MGAAFTYGMDVASYLFVIAALFWWKRPVAKADALTERFGGAFRAGLCYARASRALHVVLVRAFCFFALASSVWGLLPLVARNLLIGAAGLVGVALVSHRLTLPKGDADLVPSSHWPEPLTAEPVAHDRGPVMILIEYRVDRADREPFLAALAELSAERRRDGAYAWGVTEDTADPGLMVEWFQVESWAEHLRQHQRVSKADADVQASVLRFHRGEGRAVVRHLLAAERGQR